MEANSDIIRTKTGQDLIAFAEALFDGLPFFEAAKAAGSKAVTPASLGNAAARLMAHPDFARAVQAVRKRREPLLEIALSKGVRMLVKDLDDPNWRCRLAAYSELRKTALGDSRIAGVAGSQDAASAGSFLEALASAVRNTGSSARLSVEITPPTPQDKSTSPLTVDAQAEAVNDADASEPVLEARNSSGTSGATPADGGESAQDGGSGASAGS